MEAKTPYQLAVERAGIEGKCVTFRGENVGVRSLSLQTIPMNEPFVIPEDYKVFKMEIRANVAEGAKVPTALKVITEEGYDFWVSCLTRGAKDANTGEYIPASGTVVEEVQQYASMEEAFDAIAGRPMWFTNKHEVDSVFNGQPRTVNVYQIDFVPDASAPTTPEPTTPTRARRNSR